MAAERFSPMTSDDAQTAQGIFKWTQRFIDDLNRLRRLWALADMDLTGKAGYKVVVNADATGFTLVP